jgi:RNA polymerase Rpb2, domain 6
MEIFSSNTSQIIGGFYDSTITQYERNINLMQDILTNEGYYYDSTKIFYTGSTGEQIESMIFTGPAYYVIKQRWDDELNLMWIKETRKKGKKQEKRERNKRKKQEKRGRQSALNARKKNLTSFTIL